MIIFFRSLWVAECMVRVILFDHVFDDSAGFPDFEPSIWIDESWKTTVGVESSVLRIFDIAHGNLDGLEGKVEFGKEYGDFAWVWT